MSAALDALRCRFGSHVPGLMGARSEFAVLCPFLEKEDGLHLLFEVRAKKLSQGGQVCFPGGRMEPGETKEQCAVRETSEELSIPPNEIQLFGQSDFLCMQKGFLMHPILGIVSPEGIAQIQPSAAEVAEVFTVPVDFFKETPPEEYAYDLNPYMDPSFPFESVGVTPAYPWMSGRVDVPVWHWQGHPIWGMTARIVRDILRT